MNRLFQLSLYVFVFINGYTQVSNNDPKMRAINIALPKTPESQGIERYGNIPVNEVTGIPNISVPIYTLRSKFLELPIVLNYNASGIKVRQEASWVGLGFDLIAGGRITVETKGCVDNDGVTPRLFSNSTLKYGMQKLFARLGKSSNFAVLTFASTCRSCDTAVNNIPDDWASIGAMAMYGLGEPDIFRANFMGHSLTFYFDKITDSLTFLGEKSLFSIHANKDAFQRITDWNITDNQGIIYYFNQKENTTLTLPPLGSLSNNSSTTAWLLTRVLHPTGDEISFSYINYGNSYPINDWTSSMTFMDYDRTLTLSQDQFQNEVIQQPAYLSKIQTNAIVVDFVIGDREDIKGEGSKRLNEIRISDKQTNTLKKKATFSYDYFSGNLGSCYTSLPSSTTKYYQLRLKLNTVNVNDSLLLEPPYQFFYYNNTSIPDKKSFAVDHWGYYNASGGGNYSDPCSPKNLIPNTGAGTVLNYPELNGFATSRNCNATSLPCMTLDKIIYPTGGSTKFIYEPHQSLYIGGGLRIKTIQNYSLSRLTGSIDYTYQGGVYMGAISYHTSSYAMTVCSGTAPFSQGKEYISANGAYNDNDLLIAYPLVVKTQRNSKGLSNGYVVKLFNVPNPRYSSGGLGFDVLPAHWPTIYPNNNTTSLLFAQLAGFPPTPTMKLDGKLFKEKYYNNSNTLIKSIEYYYSQAGYSNKFYSVKAIDNRIGGFDATPNGCGGGGSEFETNGARRFTIFVSPAKSFYTLTDSVVEKTYEETNVITQKKAYKYNKFYQPEIEINYNSDGTESIVYTKTSLDLDLPPYPLAPIGDAMNLYNLRASHIYDLPIEQIFMKKNLIGDTLVVGGKFNLFEGILAKKFFMLETAKPLVYKSEFNPYYMMYPGYPNSPSGSSFTLKIDDKYKQKESAQYNAASLLKELSTVQGITSYIWDDNHFNMLADVKNANETDIAYSSFETSSYGNWVVNATGLSTDYSAPMGNSCFALLNRNITKGNLDALKTYIVSYWSKNGSQHVNGTTPMQGKSMGTWTYFEHQVTHPNGGSITLSGTGTIDELRLYPKSSFMTTYTYEPLVGLTSKCDINNTINYYEYDVIGRLKLIKDEKRNIIKQWQYKYEDSYQYPYANTEQSMMFKKNDCPAGYHGSAFDYIVPANTYGSFISVSDANQIALAEIAAFDGQNAVNASGYCTPAYTFKSCCGWNSIFSNFSLSGSDSVNFSFVIAKQTGNIETGVTYRVADISGSVILPSNTRIFNVNEGGRTWEVTIMAGGQVYIKLISGTPQSSVSITSSYML